MRSNDCVTGPKYCPKCSAELDSRAKICKFCDFNLEIKLKRKYFSLGKKSTLKTTSDYRKNIVSIILFSFLITSILFNIMFFNWILNPPINTDEKKETLIVGFKYGPSYWSDYGLDPLNAYDDGSMTIIRQVAEGLYMYDYTNPSLPRIPMLAEDDGFWEDNITWTVGLRRHIWFQDGEHFNATAVKWTFDRLLWFLNSSGGLDPSMMSMELGSLYLLPNGTSIIDEIIINDEYSVSFRLNYPFGPIKDLLCHPSASILSPKSTPKWEYIDTLSGVIVGTGPFAYSSCDGEIVKLRRWERYWRTGVYFDELIFKEMDSETRHDAMLNKEIDYLMHPAPSMYSLFKEDPSFTCDNSIVGANYHGLVLANERINSTWREAISYAINYSSIIEEWPKDAIRAENPLTSVYFGYDPSVKTPIYNSTRAREIVVSMGFGNMNWSNEQWRNADFFSFNQTFPNTYLYENLFVNLYLDLELIGIDLQSEGACWAEWDPSSHWAEFNSYWISWYPDYLDPINTFYNVFSSKTQYYTSFFGYASNSGCNDFLFIHYGKDPYINNSWLEQKYIEALSEINDTKRALKYAELQHYLAEELFPNVFGFHNKVYNIHSSDLRNIPYNPLDVFYAWPIYRYNSD